MQSSPPHMTSPPRKPGSPWGVVAVVLVVAFFGFGGLLAIWQFLEPTDRKVMVAYSTFIDDVHAGHVSEIRIRNRDIDYRLSDQGKQNVMRHTIGPVPDQAFLDTLKPFDPLLPPPKVMFEK